MYHLGRQMIAQMRLATLRGFMKTLLMNTALLFALAFPTALLAEVSLIDGKLSRQEAGSSQNLDLEEGAIVKVNNSDMVFVYVTDSASLKAAGQSRPALLFFDNNGRMIGAFAGNEGFEPEMCSVASLSPGRKIIALDNGTWLLRIWIFLNFPDFTQASEAEEPYLSYFSSDQNVNLAWVDDDTVLVTDVSEAPVSRPCPADPCEPLDVVVHYIKEWSTASIAKGTELCNYNLESLSKRTATVVKTCTKSIDDWGMDDPAKRTVSREKIQVPQR